MENSLLALKQLRQDYIDTFSDNSGKAVLEDLQRRCFIKTSTIADEAIRMAFNEGRRTVFMHIESMINLDMNKVEEQLKKQKEQEKEGA